MKKILTEAAAVGNAPARALACRVLGSARKIEGDEERAVELCQGLGGKLASPAPQSAGRQGTDLLTQGDRIAVEAPV
jgi:hypothetical protein